MSDNRDKHRTPSFTPKKDRPNQDPESLRYLEWCRDKIKFYPDSENGIEKLLIDLGEKGANLNTIVANLHRPRSAETRQSIQGVTLKADFKKHRKHLRLERAIRNAFNLLEQNLKPVLCEYGQNTEVNIKIEGARKVLRDCQPTLEKYLDLLLVQTCQSELVEETGLRFMSEGELGTAENRCKMRRPERKIYDSEKENLKNVLELCPPNKIREWIKEKGELKSRTHKVWAKPTSLIVRELITTGFSNNSAYMTTAELFKLQYPEIFADDLSFVADQVKARCRYYETRE